MSGAAIKALLTTVMAAVLYLPRTDGHGMMLDPISRSSMWRLGVGTPINYNDNQLFCGGFAVQWGLNGGRCGICGDSYSGPRNNEAGGLYATGRIARTYRTGEIITVTTMITMNHGGHFEFRLCPNNDPTRRITEACLKKHRLALPNGQTRWELPFGHPGNFSVNLVLPQGLTCSQCVLQGKWYSASNWGCDVTGCGKGHGPEEQYVNCADVAITSSGLPGSNLAPEPVVVTSRPLTKRTTTSTTEPTTKARTIRPNIIMAFTTQAPKPAIRFTTPPMAAGFMPIGLAPARCEATMGFKQRYLLANQWCEVQCAKGNCPASYCKAECRVSTIYSDHVLIG